MVNAVIRLFNQLTQADKVRVAEQISNETFRKRWMAVDAELPDTDLSDEEIIKELRAVRYGEHS